jgi:hypothetical protein
LKLKINKEEIIGRLYRKEIASEVHDGLKRNLVSSILVEAMRHTDKPAPGMMRTVETPVLHAVVDLLVSSVINNLLEIVVRETAEIVEGMGARERYRCWVPTNHGRGYRHCILDTGTTGRCYHSQGIKKKEDCKYWRLKGPV